VSRAPDRAASCAGEPVSWLRVERYHLGELGDDERAAVAEHLGACDVCAACLGRIREDEKEPLPALAGVVVSKAAAAKRTRDLAPFGARGAVAWIGGLAAAAVLALVLGPLGGGGPAPGGERQPAAEGARQGARVKGGAVAFVLVRDDGARIEGTEGVYRDGDRFKAVVTCPPDGRTGFDLTVTEEGASLVQGAYPLPPATDFACGNGVPLPGAFRLTGGAVQEVCLVWNEEGPVDRQEAPGGRPTLCKRLAPGR
jgi:hypothetical protein